MTQQPQRAILDRILRCPTCGVGGAMRREQETIRCGPCGCVISLTESGAALFEDAATLQQQEDPFHVAQFSDQGLVAALFNRGQKIVNSDYTPRNQLSAFLSTLQPSDVVVELGSGRRRLTPTIVNVDLFPFGNVDVVSDIARVPLADGSVDAVVLDTVIEHVPEPHVVVDEIFRILRPGGRVICLAPFIFPYHAYPKHYFNISKDGLEFLFRRFSSCEVEMNVGPTAALTNFWSEYVASAISGKSQLAYTLAKGVGLAPVFLLKYLDRFWVGNPAAVRISSILCAQVVK